MKDQTTLSPQYYLLSKEELLDKLKKHVLFLKKYKGGKRASFKFCDLGGQDFHALNLSGVDFSAAQLDGANFENCNLKDAIFYCANLAGSNLKKADLTHSDLRGACLKGAVLDGACLVAADMRNGSMMRMQEEGEGLKKFKHRVTPTRMNEASAKGANFERAALSGSFMVQTDLSGCNMRKVKFNAANLSHCNLTGTDMSGADLSACNLSGAQLQSAVLNNTIINEDTNLSNAFLIGAAIDDSVFEKLKDSNCVLSPSLEEAGINLAKALKSHKNWVDSDGKKGTRLDLSTFNLSGAGKIFEKQDLSGAIFQSSAFQGGSLKGANLTMADLSTANLYFADISNTHLMGTNFKAAILIEANFDNTKFEPLTFSKNIEKKWPCSFENARLNKASFRNCHFVEVNFKGAELGGANFEGASFENCDFDGANPAPLINELKQRAG